MPFYEKGNVRIRYEETGSGFPLFIIYGGGLSHPYAVAMEMAHLAPDAQVSLFPWKDNKENVKLAVRHVRAFLKANRPAVVC